MTLEQVEEILANSNFKIVAKERTNNYGYTIKLDNKCIVNIWDSGKITFQGKNIEQVKLLFENCEQKGNKKVFVVYGHDTNARTQLDAMLRRWGVEPLILDQIVSSGQTIIEKLEEHINQVKFGIVLATPDDIGYAKNNENNKKFRVRQNVVLELGMLLSAIGRSKVAILLSKAEEMEAPSDIQGLIYIPFKENVEEARVPLAKEMRKNGFNVEIESL